MILITANCVTSGWRKNVMTQNVNSVLTDRKPQIKKFRQWVEEVWRENCEEHLTYGENPYKLQEYWTKYKWWLKREYQHQRQK
jgi:hypothetical protein